MEKAVTKVLDTVVDKAKAVWGAVKGGAGKVVDKGRQVAAAVGQKVKGWLGFRKEFTLPNHEKHTLFFRQDGQLMLASDPTPYLDFLARQDRLSKVPATDAEHIKAHALADEIRVLATTRKALNEAHGLHLQQEKARLQGAVTTAHQDQTRELTQNAADLDAKMVELGQVTMLLLQAQHSDKQPPRANHAVWAEPRVIAPASGRRQAQVYGTGVLMEYFTTQPIAAGSSRLVTTGREPSAAVNAEFGDINLRRNGASAYYVKGHLLSQQLHGPGDWKNLTPLSRAGNAEHEDKVEALVKKVAAKSTYDPARWKPGDPATARYAPAAAYYYSVVPQYGRPLRQDLWDQSAGNDPLQRIIQAEQGVPRSLVCILWEVDRVTGQKIKEEAAFTVNNPVEQGGLFDYQTEEVATIVKINAIRGTAQVQELAKLVGGELAAAIENIRQQPPHTVASQAEWLAALKAYTGSGSARLFTDGEIAKLDVTFSLLVKRKQLSFA